MHQKVRINGKYRNYGSVRVSALGATFVGVGKIEYKREDAIDPVKAVGTTKSIGYTRG